MGLGARAWVAAVIAATVGCGTSGGAGGGSRGPTAPGAGVDAGTGGGGGTIDGGTTGGGGTTDGGGTGGGGTDGGGGAGGGGTTDGGGTSDGGGAGGGGATDGGAGPVLHTLHVGLSGTGTVTASGATSATCSQSCDLAVPDGATETLAGQGATFTGACSGAGSCSLVLTGDQSVTATFPPAGPTFQLKLFVGGQGSGTVTSSPPGMTCTNGTCTASFPANAQVTLTAAPGAGSNLAYWGGECARSGLTCSFPANADRYVVVAFEPPPPIRYTVRDLPQADTPKSINRQGDVVGWSLSFGNGTDGNGFLYDSSTGQTRELPPTSSGSQAFGLNDAMQVATTVLSQPNGVNTARAMRIDADGSLHDLGTLGGNTWAYGIDGSGQVVGWSAQSLANGGSQLRAFLHDGSQMRDLSSLDGTCSEAHAIAGQIVGTSCIGQRRHAVIFHSGAQPEDIDALVGWSEAWGVSSAGYIVGTTGSTVAGDGVHGFIRPPGGAMQDVPPLPGGWCSWLAGVNDSGVAAGHSCLPRTDPFTHGDTMELRAAAYVNGRLWDLVYMTGDTDLVLSEAEAINAAGWIVAHGYRPGRTDVHAFLLVPQR